PLRTRAAAKERTPPTPAAAGDDLARGRDDCEVGAVLDQRSIDPKGALQRPFDLRIRVITGAQRAGGARDEIAQRRDVYRSGEAEREAHPSACRPARARRRPTQPAAPRDMVGASLRNPFRTSPRNARTRRPR